MKMSNFEIENDDLTINEFMEIYDNRGDPVDEIIKVIVKTYIRKYLGKESPKEIISTLSQYGVSFEYHINEFFNS